MHDSKLIMILGLFLSNITISTTKINILPQIHHSMVELYDAMNKGNHSISNVYKILAVPGQVKSEDPCRIQFKLPKIHHPTNILKIDLHIMVIIHHYMRLITASLDFRYN